MGVYGLVWTQLGHWYRYRGTAVLFRYLTVLFRYLGSIHTNTYNVPSEPERAAKARRAVVASISYNFKTFAKDFLHLGFESCKLRMAYTF